MHKRTPLALSLFSLTSFCLATKIAAADCICPHMPMYQVNGGWFHYATVHAPNCGGSYPTGYIANTAEPNVTCNGTCDLSPCHALGPAAPANLTYYFDNPLMTYDALVARTFPGYMVDIFNGPINDYDGFTFTPIGSVPIVRTVNNTSTVFFAAIFRMKDNAQPSVFGYVGVEISDTGVGGLRLQSQCNAIMTSSTQMVIRHDPVPGLLTVTMANAANEEIRAIVRLQTRSNAGVNYPVCRPGESRTHHFANERSTAGLTPIGIAPDLDGTVAGNCRTCMLPGASCAVAISCHSNQVYAHKMMNCQPSISTTLDCSCRIRRVRSRRFCR